MNVLQSLQKNRFLRLGLPFITMLVGGSFGLKYFAEVRYLHKERQTLRPEDVEALGIKKKETEEVTLESEYEKLQRSDLDTWSNIRGPRPWEDSKEVQGKLRQEVKEAGKVSPT